MSLKSSSNAERRRESFQIKFKIARPTLVYLPHLLTLLILFQNKQVSLWTCYAKSCWRMFIVSGVFKLFGDLCGLVGPLSISYIVDFIGLQLAHESTLSASTVSGASINDDGGGVMRLSNLPNGTNEAADAPLMNYPDWSGFIANGWIMSGIVLIAFLLQGTFSQASTNLINIEGIKIKNALQGLIYRKTLSLSASCFHMTSKPVIKKKSDENSVRSGRDEHQTDDDCDLKMMKST